MMVKLEVDFPIPMTAAWPRGLGWRRWLMGGGSSRRSHDSGWNALAAWVRILGIGARLTVDWRGRRNPVDRAVEVPPAKVAG